MLLLFLNGTKSPDNYEKSLVKLADEILYNRNVQRKLLIRCIPKNEKETIIFTSLDYNNDFKYQEAFKSINDLWIEKSISGDKKILKYYLEYSKYVDGYFAEDYFINIDKILKFGNLKQFYKVLDKCDPSKITRVKLYLDSVQTRTSDLLWQVVHDSAGMKILLNYPLSFYLFRLFKI